MERLAGVLIGSFNGFKDERDTILARGVPHLALEAAPEHVAVVSGFVYGHIPRRMTLPMGVVATVDTVAGALQLVAQ